MIIETVHLRLMPFSPAHLLALIESAEAFKNLFGLQVADGIRALYSSDDVSPIWLANLRTSATAAADPWVYGFAVVHAESQSVIGTVGFKGAPDENGIVEIAYGIAPGFRGSGYATEATDAGVAFAFGSNSVRLVRAHTLPTNIASIRVLAKCGFTCIGEVMDPEDGLVLRWELSKDLN